MSVGRPRASRRVPRGIRGSTLTVTTATATAASAMPRASRFSAAASGDERADHRGDHPGGREAGEDRGVQPLRVDASDDDVQRGARHTGAEALHHPRRDEHVHGRGQPGPDQPDCEEHEADHEGRPGPTPVGEVARPDDADDPGGEGGRERHGVERLPVELAGDRRHHGGQGQRLEGVQRNEGDDADGRRPQRRGEQPPAAGIRRRRSGRGHEPNG